MVERTWKVDKKQKKKKEKKKGLFKSLSFYLKYMKFEIQGGID